MTHSEKATALFMEGYNCAQSVFLAFEDMYELDRKTALRISSGFGGGMGRLREVCGCVSGAFMAAGLLMGYDDVADLEEKKKTYSMIQDIANAFRDEQGSIICREILKLRQEKVSPVPSARTEEYYKTRPCAFLCGLAAQILDDYLSEGKSEK